MNTKIHPDIKKIGVGMRATVHLKNGTSRYVTGVDNGGSLNLHVMPENLKFTRPEFMDRYGELISSVEFYQEMYGQDRVVSQIKDMEIGDSATVYVIGEDSPYYIEIIQTKRHDEPVVYYELDDWIFSSLLSVFVESFDFKKIVLTD